MREFQCVDWCVSKFVSPEHFCKDAACAERSDWAQNLQSLHNLQWNKWNKWNTCSGISTGCLGVKKIEEKSIIRHIVINSSQGISHSSPVKMNIPRWSLCMNQQTGNLSCSFTFRPTPRVVAEPWLLAYGPHIDGLKVAGWQWMAMPWRVWPRCFRRS